MWKALVIILLAAAIFGGGWYFTDKLFLKPERILLQEQKAREENPPTPPPDPSLKDYQKLEKLKSTDDPVAAREAYRQFLRDWPDSTKLDEAKDTLGQINTDIFFSRYPAPEKQKYIVQRGDALVKIAAKMKTTAELIMRSNNLDGTLINVGDELLISQPDFALLIDQAKKTVTLYNHGEFFKRYKPTSWDAPGRPQPSNSQAKVTETIAWHNGERVAFGSKNYLGATRWILTSVPSIALYSDFAKAGESGKTDKPASGIGLAPEEMDELAALVRRGTPITFE
jgi:LysM repeat protein